MYEENGQVKSEEVFINSNTEKLIGHHIGEKVTLDRFGIISTAKYNAYSINTSLLQDKYIKVYKKVKVRISVCSL